MAIASAFGISGWDPLASAGEGFMNSFFTAKQMKKQAKIDYQYAEKYARNAPSWNVAGLRSAGINPILAVNGGNIGDVTNPNITPSPVDTGSATRGGFDRRAFEEQKLALDSTRAQIDVNSSLADKAKSEELKTLVSAMNDLQDGGQKGDVGAFLRMGSRLFGVKQEYVNDITHFIGQRIGKLLGVKTTTSAKDRRSDDGKVVPAPNSAKSSVSVSPASSVSVAPVNVPRRMRREIDFSKHDVSRRPRRHN